MKPPIVVAYVLFLSVSPTLACGSGILSVGREADASASGGNQAGGDAGAGRMSSSGSDSSSGGSASSGAGDADGCGSTSSGLTTGWGSGNQGIVVMPASDLPAPAPSAGIQIATPDYDAADVNASRMIVQPGQEAYLCYFVTLPGTAQVDVGALQSWMSPVGSQDLIVHARDAAGDAGGVAVPSGTLQSCATRGGSERVLHWAAEPGAVVSAYMPQGVGTSLAAGSQLVLSMHFSNAGCSPLTPKVKLNLLYAKNIQYQAGLLVSFNTSIDVPAATALGPGTQTVTGTCQAPAGSKFFIATTHTNGRATAAAIDIVSGGQSAEIVHTGPAPSYPADQEPGSGADWQRPGVGLWTAPNFLTVNAGDSFAYRCSYSNTGNKAVAVGETIADEMCATVMYYYPAGVATCN